MIPFGFGLSYSSFSYSLSQTPPQKRVSLEALRRLLKSSTGFLKASELDEAMKSGWQAGYAVNVTNTGKRDADDVVLGFLVPPKAGQDGIPLKTLFGFQRVHVKAGATETVWLYPSLKDFARVGARGELELHEGEYRVQFGVPETHGAGMGFVEDRLMAVEPVAYI